MQDIQKCANRFENLRLMADRPPCPLYWHSEKIKQYQQTSALQNRISIEQCMQNKQKYVNYDKFNFKIGFQFVIINELRVMLSL